ncbi:MAG: hypothetical protein R3E77_11290 [Steroidobacteraceae bacterium]
MSRAHNVLAHSWPLSDWPADVYPNSTERARYVLRAHRRELVEAGAMVRVGRELVVLARGYDKWLQRRGARVFGYECAAYRKSGSAR